MTGPFDAGIEHYPMSGLDEYLIHNHPHPVRVMWTSDPQAYERMWFTCQDRTGDLLVVAGMGSIPTWGRPRPSPSSTCAAATRRSGPTGSWGWTGWT